MQRVITVFLVFLLIVYVVPKCYGVEPLPLDTRLEMTVDISKNILPLSEIYTLDDVKPDFSSFGDGVITILLGLFEIFHTLFNILYIPIADVINVIAIAGVWLVGYIPPDFQGIGVLT